MAYSSIKRKTPIKKSQKPLKRTPLKKKPYKIAPVSEKRKAQMREYSKLRKSFLDQNKQCQAAMEGCSKKATDVHHMQGRENDRLLDDTKWLAVCRVCHRKITDNAAAAISMGLSYSKHRV
jgi:hypothetical protein